VRRLRVRHFAAQDIEQIFDYIAEAAGDETARRFTADIERQYRKTCLATGHPWAGASRTPPGPPFFSVSPLHDLFSLCR
jgi:plasmid stabilization system protein ParE